MSGKICITTDCVCDLPREMLKAHNIDMLYFYIETDSGRFRDVDEITAENIFEYLREGGIKSETKAPPTDEFFGFFQKKLKKYDEIIHIAISSKLSMSVANANAARERLGKDAERVHIFDSEHLSTGMGYLVLKAAELADAGKDVQAVLDELTALRSKISTTFIAYNADYLYRNGKVSKNVKDFCGFFNIHPVLEMKDGHLKLKSVEMGSYEKSMMRYVRRQLKNTDSVNSSRLFITHAGCSINDVKMVKREVNRIMTFDSIDVTKASATISGNSGPRTIGVLFVRK